MENFNLLDGSDTLKASRDTINNNLLSVRSLSSGTAFPTDNLSVGMLCYRTDLKRLYQYKEDGSWTADIAMSISGNANTANSAGSAANANHADTADTCTGNAATATTAETCTGNSATATALKTARNINGVSFDGSKNIDIPVGVRTVNGIEPDANGDVLVAGLPIGHEWWTSNPNIPTGCLPLFGGTYSRTAYADLWSWVQTQGSYLISESEWQAKATANDGNVVFYSDGDGSTTFRVPSLKCHVQGANGVEEVGSYLAAGLPNITGSAQSTGGNDTAAFENTAGAFDSEKGSYKPHSASSSKYANLSNIFSFDASLSNPIYGNSDTVQPPSVVGMWLVKAFGTVSNVGNQDIADVSAGLTRVENKMDEYTDNVAYIEAFIVETWRSDDGSSWYRKYSDGWIEQGGVTPNVKADSYTVTLNTPFTTVNYHVNFITTGTGKDGSFGHCVSERTNTTFTMYDYLMNGVPVLWYACGY